MSLETPHSNCFRFTLPGRVSIQFNPSIPVVNARAIYSIHHSSIDKSKMDLDSDTTEDERHLEAEVAPTMGKRRTSSVRFDDKPTVVSFEK